MRRGPRKTLCDVNPLAFNREVYAKSVAFWDFFFFFFTLVTGPRRSLSLKLSDTKVYEPQIRALTFNREVYGKSVAFWDATDIRLPGKGNSNSHGARPVYYNHLDD